jgi:LuxR family transcriptional regulator, maltose regulon positive regulatory protein
LMTAWIAAVCGDLHTMEERLAALDPATDIGPLPDGSPSVAFSVAILRGSFGFDGPEEMLAAARKAVELAPDEGSPWCASAHLTLGNALLIVGDDAGAEGWLRRVLANTEAPGLTRIAALALLALVELDRRHVEDGRRLAEASLQIAQDEGFTDTPQASLAYTALGRAHAETGHLEDALPVLEHGLALRRKMANLSPWPTIHHALVMAPVLMALGRPAPAHQLVDEVDRLLGQWTGGTEAMRARLAQVEEAVQALSRVPPLPAAEPLTDREESVLRLLVSTRSMREIASELYLSHNTVKTHAQMVYRKLGASSRAEAVDIARRRGLV